MVFDLGETAGVNGEVFIMLGNGDVFYKASKLGVGESGSNIQGGILWWRFDFLFSAE
jgi:hypothetical protein